MSALKIQKLAEAIKSNQDVTAELKRQMEPFVEAEEALREEMLKELKKMRMTSYKDEVGFSFSRVFRTGVEVVDNQEAMKWASENGCLKIDTTKAQQKMRGAGATPPGFAYKETETLRVSKPTEPMT